MSSEHDPEILAEHPDANEEQLTRNFEYNEGYSIPEIHGAIMREKDEPHDGLEPVPLWLTMIFGALVFWGGAYMAFYSGGFQGNVFDETAVSWSGGGASAVKTVDPVATGKRLFTANCAVCHQGTGLGVPGQYPPLAGSEIVQSQQGWGENHIARIVLNGLSGPIHVKGVTINSNMPAWKDNLKDEQIAYILTYIRQEWGNTGGPIAPEGIAAVRKEMASRTQPWSEGELKAIPAAALAAPAPAPAAPAGQTSAAAPATAGAPAAAASAPKK